MQVSQDRTPYSIFERDPARRELVRDFIERQFAPQDYWVWQHRGGRFYFRNNQDRNLVKVVFL
jgi:hypothetical protein